MRAGLLQAKVPRTAMEEACEESHEECLRLHM